MHTHPQKLVFLYIFQFILPAAWVGISLSSCQSINQRYKIKTLGCLGATWTATPFFSWTLITDPAAMPLS